MNTPCAVCCHGIGVLPTSAGGVFCPCECHPKEILEQFHAAAERAGVSREYYRKTRI